MRQPITLLLAGMVLVGFGGWFYHQQQLMATGHLPTTTRTQLIVQVQPDDVRIGPDSVQLRGKLPSGYWIEGRFYADNSQLEAYRLRQTSQMMLTGDVDRYAPATNVNEFDFGAYQAHRWTFNQIKIIQLQQLTPVQARNPWTIWVNGCHALRYWLIERTKSLPETLRLYVQGLFLGYRADGFYERLAAVKDLGLIHLFSISGFHVIWLVALIEWGMALLRLPQGPRVIGLCLILPSYVIIAGGGPGVIRAVLVVLIGILAKLGRVSLSRLTVWGLSLLIGLAISPAMLTELGGQLSYGLAFSLIFLNQRSLLFQTLMLNLISLPTILYHIYQWHVLSLFVNLLLLPLFSWLVFPVVFGLMWLGPSWPVAAGMGERGLQGLTFSLDWVAQLPGMVVTGQPTALMTTGLCVLTFMILAAQTARIRRWLFGLLIISYAGLMFWRQHPLDGEVTFFDIGQGDSFLIREPGNRQVIMIDTGGKVTFGSHRPTGRSTAERVSINYLKSLGITQIDHLLLSHQDADHTGDVDDVLAALVVKRLYVPLGMTSNERFMKRVQPALMKHRTQVIEVQAGQSIEGTQLQVVHPFKAGEGTNEDSMVLFANYGQLSWLFTGDLDQAGERQIAAHFPQLTVDVLKLGHHGSKTSSDPTVVAKWQPKIGIISAGRENRYGHPNQETLATLAKQQVPYFSTQQNGMVTYRFRAHAPGYWQTFLKGAFS